MFASAYNNGKLNIQTDNGWTTSKARTLGRLGGSGIEHLPSAQGVIPESRNRVPHQTPYKESASPSACVSASLFVSLMNK